MLYYLNVNIYCRLQDQAWSGLLCKYTVCTLISNLKNSNMSYAGYIMRNTSGHYDTLLRTIEGRLEGKRGRGRPRRTWVDDLRDWTGTKQYDQIKKAAGKRDLHGTFATHSSGSNNERMHIIKGISPIC